MTGYLIGGAVACAAVLCAAFSVKPIVRQYAFETEKVKRRLRILQLSDLHDTRFGADQAKLSNIVRSAKPDLIVMTGDMVHDTDRALIDKPILYDNHPTRLLLEAISDTAPMYAVLGNHEHALERREELVRELAELGVTVLNGSVVIEVAGELLYLVGIDDPRFFGHKLYSRSISARIEDDSAKKTPELLKWRGRVRELAPSGDELSILLSHRPEEFEIYFDAGYDLTFSGHAHGGQWRLPPFINGVYAPHQGLFPRHAGGLYRDGSAAHVVSRGLSISQYPRIFNRPEVCIVDIIPVTIQPEIGERGETRLS